MSTVEQLPVRFGPFQLDLRTLELFKNGEKLKLQPQPIQVLGVLLERPGQLVTREELCHRLWSAGTFVDFEHSLNTAIKKLRQALGDEAETPVYIETLPRRGYRFIFEVNRMADASDTAVAGAGLTELPPEQLTAPRPLSAMLAQQPRRTLAVAALFVLAAAAGAAYWLLLPRTLEVSSIQQITRSGLIKSIDNTFFEGSFPATDGTRVYFNEKGRVAQVSTRGGEVSYLESLSQASLFVESISADNSELLVEELTSLVDSPFWIIPLPDGPARRIPGEYMLVAFLTGTDRIVYVRSSDRTHLFSAKRDATDSHLLMTFPAEIGPSFAISPDGQRLRFATSDNRMWESRLDGSGMHRFLPKHVAISCCGKWSPDGATYIFASLDGDIFNLWAVPESSWLPFRAQPKATRLTSGPISFEFSIISKDSKQIFALGESMRGELSIFDEKAGAFRKYLNGISAGFVNFSRDGQWVAYVRHPQGDLWRSRIDGSERMQLATPPDPGMILDPKWSPDGRLIAFMAWGNERRIFLVSPDGGSPMPLLGGDFLPADPSWSPDGKFLAYGGGAATASPAARTEIRILDLQTGDSKPVSGSQGLFSPRWSPDGSYIAAISENMDRLLLYSVRTKRWRPLNLPPSCVTNPLWSHDGRDLYVYAGCNAIYRLRMSDQHTETVVSNTGILLRCPALSWFGGCYELTPDDRIIGMIDRGSQEIYALNLETK